MMIENINENNRVLVTKSSMPEFEEYVKKIKSIWDTKWLTNMGALHNELQEKLKEYLTVENISLFVNGHQALELTLETLEKKGEIITTPFTFASTTHAIVRSGFKPVFCDINPVDYTIDVDKLESLINENTVAILPVHVYGNICDVERLEQISNKYDLKLIYDAAHAFGVRYMGKGIAEYGDMSMFSFHATKVFNTIEGGAICLKDSSYLSKLNGIKNFGIRNEESVDMIGSNAKMNEFQAAMGLCNLENIDDEIEKRHKIVNRYRERLIKCEKITLNVEQENVKSNYAYFPILVENGKARDGLYEYMRENNVYTRKYFYPLTNSFECYQGMYDVNDTPIAKDISERVLTLPLYADLELEIVDYICDKIISFIESV